MTTKAEALEAAQGILLTAYLVKGVTLEQQSAFERDVQAVRDFINSAHEWKPIGAAPLDRTHIFCADAMEAASIYVMKWQVGDEDWQEEYLSNWTPPPITGETK